MLFGRAHYVSYGWRVLSPALLFHQPKNRKYTVTSTQCLHLEVAACLDPFKIQIILIFEVGEGDQWWWQPIRANDGKFTAITPFSEGENWYIFKNDHRCYCMGSICSLYCSSDGRAVVHWYLKVPSWIQDPAVLMWTSNCSWCCIISVWVCVCLKAKPLVSLLSGQQWPEKHFINPRHLLFTIMCQHWANEVLVIHTSSICWLLGHICRSLNWRIFI